MAAGGKSPRPRPGEATNRLQSPPNPLNEGRFAGRALFLCGRIGQFGTG